MTKNARLIPGLGAPQQIDCAVDPLDQTLTFVGRHGQRSHHDHALDLADFIAIVTGRGERAARTCGIDAADGVEQQLDDVEPDKRGWGEPRADGWRKGGFIAMADLQPLATHHIAGLGQVLQGFPRHHRSGARRRAVFGRGEPPDRPGCLRIGELTCKVAKPRDPIGCVIAQRKTVCLTADAHEARPLECVGAAASARQGCVAKSLLIELNGRRNLPGMDRDRASQIPQSQWHGVRHRLGQIGRDWTVAFDQHGRCIGGTKFDDQIDRSRGVAPGAAHTVDETDLRRIRCLGKQPEEGEIAPDMGQRKPLIVRMRQRKAGFLDLAQPGRRSA